MDSEKLFDELDFLNDKIREIEHTIRSLQTEKRQLERQYRYAADIIKYGEVSPAIKKAYG